MGEDGSIYAAESFGLKLTKLSRNLWTKGNHKYLGKQQKDEISSFLMLSQRTNTILNKLPRDIIFYIFGMYSVFQVARLDDDGSDVDE